MQILSFIRPGAATEPSRNILPKIEKLFWTMMADTRLDPVKDTFLLNVYQNNVDIIRRFKIINDNEYIILKK